MAEQLVNALVTLLCVLLCLLILYGGYYLSKHIVEREHRARVLEDSYNAAEEHIRAQEREIAGLNSQIEQMQYEAQLNGERMARPRSWNPSNPLLSTVDRQSKEG